MAFTIPNAGAASFAIQAEVFQTDLDILVQGDQGRGVYLNCQIAAQGSPNMTLACTGGAIFVNGLRVAAASNAALTVTTADPTNPRLDLVYVSSAGVFTYLAGTPAANPIPPSVPANGVACAFVYVPAGDTAIDNTQITDKRVIVPDIRTAITRTRAIQHFR